MEFKIGDGVLVLPALHIWIMTIIIMIFLVKWSKQLETRRFTVFLYFLSSTYIAPIYSHSTEEGIFQLWVPLGFIAILFYLFLSKRYHRAKMKASIVGFCVAMYLLFQQYNVWGILTFGK